ncbi:MAG: enterotoxin [Pirellulales bacterium]|nr:enterotoxin [Pirellulales bacterium]
MIRRQRKRRRDLFLRSGCRDVVVSMVVLAALPACAIEFPGPQPGTGAVRIDGDRIVLENHALMAVWQLADGKFALTEMTDRMAHRSPSAKGPEAFVLRLADGQSIKASELRRSGKPAIVEIKADTGAERLGDRSAGRKVRVPLTTPDASLQFAWEAEIRDGSNAVRQVISIDAVQEPVRVEAIQVPIEAQGIRLVGDVDGSVLVGGNGFFACEHPLADNRLEGERGICSMRRYEAIQPGRPWQVAFGFGVVPEGQLRRGFLYYVERQRPRPYRPFIHYNSWYDIVLDKMRIMDQGPCLKAIETFGKNLTQERDVKLDSFVFDEGWSDHKTLWGFNEGFPHGFTELRQAAGKYGSALGVWLSPWGGYGIGKEERLKYGSRQGFETNENGFSLAGPKYYARFHDTCSRMISQYGVNYFKFDGLGVGNDSRGAAGTAHAPDIDAMLRLIGDLREVKSDVFISVTTGTWPSPYWLWHGDSIWRQGDDYGFFGKGPKRLQWLTYRDMVLHKMIVRRGPLYPLNSLMIVGVAFGKHILPADMSNDLKELTDEFRMLFGSGTQNAELYISPEMMTAAMWDRLAEAAAWARANADTLVDVHWVGGDPAKGEPYGYASWSALKGILALRNPTGDRATLAVDIEIAFELPAGAPRTYYLQSPWRDHRDAPRTRLTAGKAHRFDLAPYEVLVLEALPQRSTTD